MLGVVYWGDRVPSHYQLAMNVSTLLASMVGQVLFGVLADVYGRRKIYGLELIVTIIASLGFAISSPGVFDSMSMVAWLIFWRIVMGIGIGADYPLSSVITAEYVRRMRSPKADHGSQNVHRRFSPTKYRGRMIAAVFFCQSLGQLLAVLLALSAAGGFRSHIMQGLDPTMCSIKATKPEGATCARTMDRIWRLVSGLGTFPAALAIISRLTIPESVRLASHVLNFDG